jgi:hypothetical protein
VDQQPGVRANDDPGEIHVDKLHTNVNLSEMFFLFDLGNIFCEKKNIQNKNLQCMRSEIECDWVRVRKNL